jgi:aminodeoxyfutalosine deaminase
VRWIAAPYLFPCNQPPVKNGILKCTDDGIILEIIKNEAIAEKTNLEYYNGFLVPGFVNAHCHLELSHLKNKTSFGQKVQK